VEAVPIVLKLESRITLKARSVISEIYAPLSGTVVAVNSALDGAPETMNRDPYGEGWIFEIEISNQAELDSLLEASGYSALVS